MAEQIKTWYNMIQTMEVKRGSTIREDSPTKLMDIDDIDQQILEIDQVLGRPGGSKQDQRSNAQSMGINW